MTWTYGGDPSANAKDEVRWLVGDIDSSNPQIQDEEINYVLTLHADPGADRANYTAASVVARAIAAKYAGKADKTVGGLSIKYSDKRDAYIKLAEDLAEYADRGPVGTLTGPPRLSGGGQTYLGNDFT